MFYICSGNARYAIAANGLPSVLTELFISERSLAGRSLPAPFCKQIMYRGSPRLTGTLSTGKFSLFHRKEFFRFAIYHYYSISPLFSLFAMQRVCHRLPVSLPRLKLSKEMFLFFRFKISCDIKLKTISNHTKVHGKNTQKSN